MSTNDYGKLGIAALVGLMVGGFSAKWLLGSRKDIELGNNENEDKVNNIDDDNDEYVILKYKKSSNIGDSHPYCNLKTYEDTIYFDYNATTPIFPEVTIAMLPYISTSFGNPSSSHCFGVPCNHAVQKARRHVSNLICAKSTSEIIFTSCGSESDNRAIDIALSFFKTSSLSSSFSLNNTHNYHKKIKAHIVTSAVEHPAILEYLRHLVKEGIIDLTVCPVGSDGAVSSQEVSDALRKNTALVTIMHSNNESGTLQPIQDICKAVKEYSERMKLRILVHSDAAQSLGKVKIDVIKLGVDMLTIVGHKFGAPKGIGALYIRQGIPVNPLLFGGGQESGRRAGTESVALIVGLGEASRLAFDESTALITHMLLLKRQLMSGLIHAVDIIRSSDASVFRKTFGSIEDPPLEDAAFAVPDNFIQFNGPQSDINARLDVSDTGLNRDVLLQLPNTVSVSFLGIKVAQLMPSLQKKVACSAGSACHANAAAGGSISAVLVAMGIPKRYALGTLRLSFGRHTTTNDVDEVIKNIARCLRQQLILKSANNVDSSTDNSLNSSINTSINTSVNTSLNHTSFDSKMHEMEVNTISVSEGLGLERSGDTTNKSLNVKSKSQENDEKTSTTNTILSSTRNDKQYKKSYNSFNWATYRKAFNEVKADWKGRTIITHQFIQQLDRKLAKVKIYDRKSFCRFICFGCGTPLSEGSRCENPECASIDIEKSPHKRNAERTEVNAISVYENTIEDEEKEKGEGRDDSSLFSNSRISTKEWLSPETESELLGLTASTLEEHAPYPSPKFSSSSSSVRQALQQEADTHDDDNNTYVNQIEGNVVVNINHNANTNASSHTDTNINGHRYLDTNTTSSILQSFNDSTYGSNTKGPFNFSMSMGSTCSADTGFDSSHDHGIAQDLLSPPPRTRSKGKEINEVKAGKGMEGDHVRSRPRGEGNSGDSGGPSPLVAISMERSPIQEGVMNWMTSGNASSTGGRGVSTTRSGTLYRTPPVNGLCNSTNSREVLTELCSPTGALVKTKLELDTLVHELEELGVSCEHVLEELMHRSVLIDRAAFGGNVIKQGEARLAVLRCYRDELHATQKKIKDSQKLR